MAEELKEIEGMPDYFIDKSGTVYTTKVAKRYNPKGELKVLRPRIHPSGYLYYGLFVGTGKDSVRYWRRGHRLVWEAFNGKIPAGFEINHIDVDKHNNSLDNLELVTHVENVRKYWKIRKNRK